VGKTEDLLDIPGGASLETVFEHYAASAPRLKDFRKSIVLARNQQFSSGSTVIEDGDELAFLPPVSGGSDSEYLATIEHPEGHFFALTRKPIDPKTIVARILRLEDGAYVDFEGVVRNNSQGRATRYLDYECYEAMAIRVMADIGLDIAAKHSIGRVAKTVPIWKKEYFVDGEVWVEGEWDESLPRS